MYLVFTRRTDLTLTLIKELFFDSIPGLNQLLQ